MMLFQLGDIVKVPFGYLMDILYQVTLNYGWALILFSVLVRLILAPTTAKSKKNTMKMSRLQPQIQYLQKKYENDQQKLSQEMQALYKAEGVSMGAGCLWSLVPLLIIFPLFYVVREPLTWLLHDGNAAAVVDKVKEIAPSLFEGRGGYEQMVAASAIFNDPAKFKDALTEVGAAARTLEGVNFRFLGCDLSLTPQWKVWDSSVWTWDWNHIGVFLLPVLSAASQVLSMVISQKLNNSLITDEKGLQDKETAEKSQSAQTTKTMMYMMPIMSLIFGFQFPAALSLYWLISGLMTTLIDVVLTKKYRKIYDAEDASKLREAIEVERIEAEKERIRAERRAANPDGITTNTSKKKLQQAKQKEQEAAKAAAQKEYNEKKGIFTEEEKKGPAPLSGITDRPFCKGRAYQADRYSNTEE